MLQPPPPGIEATVEFEEGRISGSAGCNRYSADAMLEGSALRVGVVSITQRGCRDAVDWSSFLAALERATSIEPTVAGYVIRAASNGAIVLQ